VRKGIDKKMHWWYNDSGGMRAMQWIKKLYQSHQPVACEARLGPRQHAGASSIVVGMGG